MNDLRKNISIRIRQCRMWKEMTQAQVAASLKITQQQYAAYETGKNIPQYEMIVALCKLFDVSSDYLLCITDEL